MNNEVYYIKKKNWLCIVRPGILCGGTNYVDIQPVKSDELDEKIMKAGLEPLRYEPYQILDDDRYLPRTKENHIKLLTIAKELNAHALDPIDNMIRIGTDQLVKSQLIRAAMI